MIDYKLVKPGDRLRVIGQGAPGFASIGELITVVSCNGFNRCDTVNDRGEPAYFALSCGAARLEPAEDTRDFQSRAIQWAHVCFEHMVVDDTHMRAVRFLEEALELAQALGCGHASARAVVDYVYGRPAGDPAQEIGGTMVTLAVLASVVELDLEKCADDELRRAYTLIEKIREKNKQKPRFK